MLYNRLKGYWLFQRMITDHALSVTITADGTADFHPDKTQSHILHYTEQGQMTLPGQNDPQDFSRCYDYLFYPDKIEILFADGISVGQLFQTLKITDTEKIKISEDSHLCGADLYKGIYDFTLEDRFSIIYHVIGPRKNYTMETVYTPRIRG
jgi:hypothetical protein